MLEAIREHAKGWIAKIILVLISIPFVLFGLESYLDGGAQDNVVVEIDDATIGRQEFDQEIQTQTQRLRENMGANFDPAVVQTAEFKQGVLDNMVERRVLMLAAQDLKLLATDSSVAQAISQVQAFQDNGVFSPERYQAVLRQNGRTPAQFENEIRLSIMSEMATGPVTQAAFPSKTSAELLAKLVAQQREVAWLDVVLPTTEIAVSPAEAKAYYDKHRAKFEVPEAIEVEYVELRLADVEATQQVKEADARAFYEANKGQFGGAEQRTASHILIAAERAADAAVRAKARARAEALLKTLRANPAQFETLARTASEDPVSAEQGGSLGSFARGMMTKPFEDAVFVMKPGDLSGIVETDFGFHIIRLDGVQAATIPPFEAVRAQVDEQLRRNQAQKAFPAIAENFSNLVYENADSLAAAAQSAKLTVMKSGWMTATTAPEALQHPRVIKALFDRDAIKSRQNIEAVETAPGTLIAARVVNHRPKTLKPIASVQGEIDAALRLEKRTEAARKQGESKIADLKAGKENGAAWSDFQVVNRQVGSALGADGIKAVFQTSVASLPGYNGYSLPDGTYRILRVSRVIEPPLPEAGVMKNVSDTLLQATQTADLKALFADLKTQHKIVVRKNALEDE